MNILWLTNIPLPEASILLGDKLTPFGGWLINASKALSDEKNIQLSIAFPKININDVEILRGKKINYYVFCNIKEVSANEDKSDNQLKNILKLVKPDIVHIFGTEYPHTLSMVNICNEMQVKFVISIQGLVSICSKHYMAFLAEKVQNKFTLRDFVRQDNLKQQQKKFAIRGKFEIQAIQKAHHIIGRTTLDKALTKQINPEVQYHYCNETLREEFYKHLWTIDDCERYSIFISQATYPIKGFHLILEAMPLILKRFPKAKLYVAGSDITKTAILNEKLKISSYAKHIKNLIYKYELSNKIRFTGLLDEKQMCEKYLESNVFVCSSSIENSPNSLGEAMMLGVPCVASYVGGIPDMLKHGEEGFLYQADAPYMLAHYICEIFKDDELAIKLSKNAREHALKTHDRDKNTRQLLKIYNNILLDD